ncbi:type III-B CRISPR module-associated Cmr3 family protein [Gynuella sunshinyii]|uniref:Uncharacterized protein predicted to be involved in DNA repair (RAMP superfamily) n=1 Tax=Gynuella sunshinyii YC6258 TaxID=1445510 RepID=A0A0C5VG72_9GAMM|nr:type III-B CRISPR module-associated Cmr3 family protein [Gynuella sunshinyii]AJQ93186.1 uncharacterized protein predicted to be involved in DNA repair (RAMP superfamily) [Gynuella sunshinyii YC6258]
MSTFQTLDVDFTPVDSWFFRESRPFDAIGTSQLGSVFPPPASTVLGAFRNWVGRQLNVDWATYKFKEQMLTLPDGQQMSAWELIGGLAGHPGLICLDELGLMFNQERLYPLPMGLQQDMEQRLYRLQDSEPVRCDLGFIRLPRAVTHPGVRTRAITNTWITAEGLRTYLAGGIPAEHTLKPESELIVQEPHIGIALSRGRTIKEQMFYQTRHIRLHQGVSVFARFSGLPEELINLLDGGSDHIRFGGEGRQAAIRCQRSDADLPISECPKNRDFTMTLLTAASFRNGDQPDWLPADAKQCTAEDGSDYWQVNIADTPVQILSAVVGKTLRQGGWDMALGGPKPVTSLIPAGSTYFCQLPEDVQPRVLEQLQYQWVGHERNLGRGLICIGNINR